MVSPILNLETIMTRKAIFLTLLSFILFQSAQAAYLIPSDYERGERFIKVTSTMSAQRGAKVYRYLECQGDIETHECTPLLNNYGFSELELNSLERNENLKGAGLLAAEVVTGGFILKRLLRFTLEHTNRFVLRKVARDPKLSHWRGQDCVSS
jgi:hypothetical protein